MSQRTPTFECPSSSARNHSTTVVYHLAGCSSFAGILARSLSHAVDHERDGIISCHFIRVIPKVEMHKFMTLVPRTTLDLSADASAATLQRRMSKSCLYRQGPFTNKMR